MNNNGTTFFDKINVQATQLVSQAYAYVTNQFSQAGKVFTLSSAYGQILSVLSNLSTMILFFIEDSVTEQNILTASRPQSVYGLARLAGHNATRAIAATGEISFNVALIPQMQGNQIIIPNYTRIQCVNNNKTYTLNMIDDQLTVDINSKTSYAISVIQGEIQTQIETGTGTPLQSYTVASRGSVLIDNFFINVYVNSTLWKAYDSLYDIPLGGQGYLVKTGISGGIDIYFGNNYYGAIPSNGAEIRIEYLQTSGSSGNLLSTDDNVFKWLDTGYDITGVSIDLNTCMNTVMSTPITFGSDPEPTSLTRLVAPKTSRSYVLANPENYIIFLEKFNYFGVVDAYTVLNPNSLSDDNIVYLYLIPDITKRLTSNDNYFTIPLNYFTLTIDEQNKVLDLIESSGQKIVTTALKIVQPTLQQYVVNITLVTYQGYSLDAIQNQIVNYLSKYWLQLRRRDLIPSSDLVSLIENIPGVDAVNVSFVSMQNETAHISNPNDPNVYGLDSLGDIVTTKDQLAVLRGGFTDRNGIYYYDGIYTDRPCSVNITVKNTVPQDLNSQLRQTIINNIINS